jgi:hypothetical protein
MRFKAGLLASALVLMALPAMAAPEHGLASQGREARSDGKDTLAQASAAAEAPRYIGPRAAQGNCVPAWRLDPDHPEGGWLAGCNGERIR